MLVTNTMEATASTTDSCQVSEPVTATQETPRTIATYTATTPAMHRKSFKEQELWYGRSVICLSVHHQCDLMFYRV